MLITFLGLLLSGQATTPQTTTDPAEPIAKSYMIGALKDPDSAQWQLVRAATQEPDTPGQTYACYRINAKNSYGAYTGYKLHFFRIESGQVIKHMWPDPDSPTASIDAALVRGLCAR
jgi:hypothetical protein